MCLIIAPGADGKKALLDREVFDFSFRRNSDGFGAMWTEDGRVNHVKMLGLKADEEYELMQKLTDEHPDVIFHMRLKTHGAVIPSLCHPFRILHKNRHGKDLFFMHNGVLSGYNTLSYGQSDTTAFKDKVLIPLLTRNPDALDDPAIMESLNKMTAGSRLIFLDSDGKVIRTSESSWNNRYGLTLSNTYMLPSLGSTYSRGVTYSNDDNVIDMYGMGAAGEYDADRRRANTQGFSLMRTIRSQGGTTWTAWCKQIVPGLVRTEYGTMYRDRGVNVVIDHTQDYVKQEDELNVTLQYQEKADKGEGGTYVPATDDLNDDVPAFEGGKPISKPQKDIPASVSEKLRYARLVHNCHDGLITSRSNMLADVMSMGNTEMKLFIKEDPENAEVILSELIEMVIEYNDILIADPTCEDLVFGYDELTELGSDEHHQTSMKMISDLRKQRYAELAEAVADMEEAKKKEKAA